MCYAFMLGKCFMCNRTFTFNPNKVPSVKDLDGVKRQICGSCAEVINDNRKAAGMPPQPVAWDAFNPVHVDEIAW